MNERSDAPGGQRDDDQRARAFAAHPESAALREAVETAGAPAATPLRDMAVATPTGEQAIARAAGELDEGGVHEVGTGQLHGHSTISDGPHAPNASSRATIDPRDPNVSTPAGDLEPGYDAPQTDWRPGLATDTSPESPQGERAERADAPAASHDRRDEPRDPNALGPPAGIVGRWPTRADDPATTTTAAPGAASGDYRAPDAAAGDGPYVAPDEDLERVGATSGLAPARTTMLRHPDGMQWDTAAADFRQTRGVRPAAPPGSDGWRDLEASVRYGYEMGCDARFGDREWDEVERDLSIAYPDWARRQGYATGGGTGWPTVRAYAHDAWEYARRRR